MLISTVNSRHSCLSVNPNVAKAGGLQRQGVEGEGIVDLLQTLDNAVSVVLRLSRRVKNMAKKDKILEFTIG
jgi:hypothetical protein